MPCVAFRIAGTPSKTSIREVSFSLNTRNNSKNLSNSEYTAMGCLSVLLAIIYLASISFYLYGRRLRKKPSYNETENGIIVNDNNKDNPGLMKSNPLLSVARLFENELNNNALVANEIDQADKNLHHHHHHHFEIDNELVCKICI